MTMLDEQLVKVLTQIYWADNRNYHYDLARRLRFYKVPADLKDKDRARLNDSGFEINVIRHYHHDDTVNALRNIAATPGLQSLIANLFMRAVGTGLRRGIQPILSYMYARVLPDHAFEPLIIEGCDNSNPRCGICGLYKDSWENDGENLYHLYIAYCRIGGYFEMLLDLREVATFEKQPATTEDLAVFGRMIDSITKAAPEETPSRLVNRLSKEKILPNSNGTSRVWLVRCLAELGILKNRFDDNYGLLSGFISHAQKTAWEMQLNQEASEYSEVSFPISGWRGRYGVNHALIDKLLATIQS